MAKNKIQFQKGISFHDFMEQYGTEDKCRRVLCQFRWPNGFVCPKCNSKCYCEFKKRKVFQCNQQRDLRKPRRGELTTSTDPVELTGSVK